MPSSVIHGMLYAPEQQTLDIVFRGMRGTYRYFGVSAAEWIAFRKAPSKGTYLNHVFKAEHPRCEKVTSRPRLVAAATTPGAFRDLPDENNWGFYETSTV